MVAEAREADVSGNACALNEPEIFNFEIQFSLNDGSRSSVNAVQTGLTNNSTVLLG